MSDSIGVDSNTRSDRHSRAIPAFARRNLNHINIEVAYANPDQQIIIPLEVSLGTTAIQAVKISLIQEKFPGIDLEKTPLGIFSKKITPSCVLRDGDRVEIYRALLADPKARRRKSALNDRS